MHEKSITVEFDGKFYNIPTVVGGKDVGRKQATQMFRSGKLKALGGRSYGSLDAAVKAARERSRKAGQRKNPFRDAAP